MYADFAELVNDLTGHYYAGLSLFKTFGFLMAAAFFVAAFVLYLELKRKRADGLIEDTIEEKTFGKPLQLYDYIFSAILGFVLGYKIIGMATHIPEASADPLSYLISKKGVLLGGVVGCVLNLLFKYFSTKEEIAKGIVVKKIRTPAYQRVGDIAIVSALFGILGAKIFNALETWDSFIANPIQSLISSSGLTFYGGLILATIALVFYAKKYKIPFKHLCDCAAPALILAYGVGRIGCQVAGDGDWGIFNSAYITSPNGNVMPSTDTANFTNTIKANAPFFNNHFAEFKEVPVLHCSKPAMLSALPDCFFASSYAHNVNNSGIAIPNCTGNYCSTLPAPVFPTPLYETIMCIFIFLFLWLCRKKWKTPLTMFGVYLILNGLERFFIEKIRVNYKYNFAGWHVTQAELIALALVFCGLFLLVKNNLTNKKIVEAN